MWLAHSRSRNTQTPERSEEAGKKRTKKQSDKARISIPVPHSVSTVVIGARQTISAVISILVRSIAAGPIRIEKPMAGPIRPVVQEVSKRKKGRQNKRFHFRLAPFYFVVSPLALLTEPCWPEGGSASCRPCCSGYGEEEHGCGGLRGNGHWEILLE